MFRRLRVQPGRDGRLRSCVVLRLVDLNSQRFDEPRAAALLAAAYGDAISPSALAYLRGAVRKRREGDTPLALTYLALAGLPPLADAAAARERLSEADALMKSGVAPATIIEALAPNLAVQRAYNPDQPRVPAGNGEISGRWKKEEVSSPAPERSFDAVNALPKPGAKERQRTLIADNSTNWLQYLSPIDDAEAAERDGKPFNGVGPNRQPDRAVAESIADFAVNGLTTAAIDKEARVNITYATRLRLHRARRIDRRVGRRRSQEHQVRYDLLQRVSG